MLPWEADDIAAALGSTNVIWHIPPFTPRELRLVHALGAAQADVARLREDVDTLNSLYLTLLAERGGQ